MSKTKLGFDLVLRVIIVVVMFIPEMLDVGFTKACISAKDFMGQWKTQWNATQVKS